MNTGNKRKLGRHGKTWLISSVTDQPNRIGQLNRWRGVVGWSGGIPPLTCQTLDRCQTGTTTRDVSERLPSWSQSIVYLRNCQLLRLFLRPLPNLPYHTTATPTINSSFLTKQGLLNGEEEDEEEEVVDVTSTGATTNLFGCTDQFDGSQMVATFLIVNDCVNGKNDICQNQPTTTKCTRGKEQDPAGKHCSHLIQTLLSRSPNSVARWHCYLSSTAMPLLNWNIHKHRSSAFFPRHQTLKFTHFVGSLFLEVTPPNEIKALCKRHLLHLVAASIDPSLLQTTVSL